MTVEIEGEFRINLIQWLTFTGQSSNARCLIADFWSVFCKFSKSPDCIRKIPLNPPLQKEEAVGMPGLIEVLPFFDGLKTLYFQTPRFRVCLIK
jgi:hypothetical protein